MADLTKALEALIRSQEAHQAATKAIIAAVTEVIAAMKTPSCSYKDAEIASLQVQIAILQQKLLAEQLKRPPYNWPDYLKPYIGDPIQRYSTWCDAQNTQNIAQAQIADPGHSHCVTDPGHTHTIAVTGYLAR